MSNSQTVRHLTMRSTQNTASSQNDEEPPFFVTHLPYSKFHNEALPPEEAYYYFPSGEEIIVPNKKKPQKAIRRIFNNVEYTKYEKEGLAKFNKLIKDNNLELPRDWTNADNLRFVYSKEFEIQKCYNFMEKHLNWRKENFPMYFKPSDNIFKILNLGFAYIFGRDHQFRPIIICQPYIYVKHKKEFSYEDWMRASVYICEYAERYMLVKGQIENWVMITYLKHVSAVTLPSSMKKVIGIMSDNYIARLYKNYVIGMSMALRILYNIVCNFLDECTVKKIVIVSDIHDGTTTLSIRKDNLEKKFGGSAPDLPSGEGKLFPPRMPDNGHKFILDREDKEKVLVSNEKYIEMYNKNEIYVPSPYVLKQLEREKEEKQRIEEEKQRIEEENEKLELAKDISQALGDFDWTVQKERKNNDFPLKLGKQEIRRCITEIDEFNLEKRGLKWEF